MDRGCEIICDLVQKYFHKLEVFDLTGCFLTKKSFFIIEKLLENNELKNELTNNTTGSNSSNNKNDSMRRPSIEENMYYIPEIVVEYTSTTNPSLRELLLQDNMCSVAHYNEYCLEYNTTTILTKSKCKLVINNNSKYIGIDFPLGYDLCDYGITEYVP